MTTTRITVVHVVLSMLWLAAVFMSWPTTAEPVTTLRRPWGRGGLFSRYSRIWSTATRVFLER